MMNANENTLYICGTRGSSPRTEAPFSEFGGDTTCFAMRFGSRGVIVDCGTGFKNAVLLLEDCERVDIFLTHFHYDHVLGLLSCPSNVFNGAPVTLYARSFGFDPRDVLYELGKPPFWPAPFYLENIDVTPLEQETVELGAVKVSWRNGEHPNGVVHYLIETPEGKSVCFMLDHEPKDLAADAEFARGASVLVYDGTFTDEEYKHRAGWGHSTIENGIKTAALSGAERLLITHHVSARTDMELREMEHKYTAVAPNVIFAREGGMVKL